ncbi:MAG: hypothetical protein EOM73_15865 [Bacteroidia bacterium]|nr:hypothetical protein [Bacteroidia bacterium]
MNMDELMKMLDELFAHMTGNVRQDEQEREDEDEDKVETEKHPRVNHACVTVLADMRREILF